MGLLLVILFFGPGQWAIDDWLSDWFNNFNNVLIFEPLQNWLIALWLIALLVTIILHLFTRQFTTRPHAT